MDTSSAVPLPCEPHGEQSGGIMHCEEQLRTTLHCDDKEKLRRKLALLQREYLRTAERLQRAERLDAVRRHVRSRISQQDQDQDQRGPEVTSSLCLSPSPVTPNTTNGTNPSGAPYQGHTGAPADRDASRRSPVIRFLLPSDAARRETLDPGHGGHRPSPALRLRSRRSRLRWERRSVEAGRRADDNSEDRRERSERMETAGAEGSEDGVKTDGTEVANESEELFSCNDSESPSLLRTHGNTCGQTDAGDDEGKEKQGRQELRGKDTELTCWNAAVHTEEREQEGTKNGTRLETEGGEEGENSREQRDGRLCEDSSNKGPEQKAAEQIESEISHVNTAEIKEENSALVVKGVSLLDSCTLVEGLLFPAEYYVRTTRRMTLSQSQPDMQAFILSQLSVGRRRRSRGRGLNKRSHDLQRSDEHAPAGLSSPSSAGPRMESQSAGLNSQSSGEISGQIDTGACFSPAVATARPARGRRKGRGRGRGRPQTPRGALSSDSGDPRPTSSQVSSSPSLCGADGPKPSISPGEAAPVQDEPQPSSGADAAQPSSTSGRTKKVFPIFLKSSSRTNGSRHMSRRSAAGWRSLLLPSSPPASTPLLPLPPGFPGPLFNNLLNSDIPQDFHLPDDQFASLKLRKLRQVAVDSGVERFTSPSYNTRRCNRRSDTRRSSSSDPAMPPPLPLSLTPTISNSPRPTEAKRAAEQSADLQIKSMEYKLIEKLASQCSAQRDITEIPGEQQIDSLHPACRTRTTATESVSGVDRVDQYKEQATVSMDHPVNTELHFANRPAGKVNDYVTGPSGELQEKESSVISSEQTDGAGLVHALEDPRSSNQETDDKSIIGTPSFDGPLQKTPEEPSSSCTAVQFYSDSEAPGESPVRRLPVRSPAKDSKEFSKPTTRPPAVGSVENQNPVRHGVPTQLLLSPPLASALAHLPSTAPQSSPTLPSLGLSPHPLRAALPLSSSPSAPALTLPPPHSPTARALSPPADPSPPGRPIASPAGQVTASSEPSRTDDRPHGVDPPNCPTRSRDWSQGSGGQVETAEEHTHTLKAPAGGCLVDACCLRSSSGGLCVAAAGAWAVCLWSHTTAAGWTLTHTWAFNKPVISVFPLPEAAGLMCVTLGQLEIREVRMLSCSSLSQALLCEGVVQAVVGVSKSRVVTSSHSASGSTLQVFTPSDSSSTWSSLPLVSPGLCVGALAPVDGLLDALIGSNEDGRLFVWNLKTGQLLRRIVLGDGLSHMACLRGYSSSGVLFVLLQHQSLSSLEDEAEEKDEESKMAALFSLVAVNPLSGASVLASRLHPPNAWSGRLCEADVSGSSVVGLSQSGGVCVWELGLRGASRMVRAPESEGWQLARWGEGGTLVTGHHNGDVTLHRHSTAQ